MSDRMGRATLLFLGASISQVPAIRFAAESGYRVAAVDGDPRAPGFAYAELSAAIDFSEVRRVEEFAAEAGVDGVLSISTDRGVVPAAAIAAELGLPGLDLAVARAMTDKAAMREILGNAGVRQPRYATVTDVEELREALLGLRLPVVLKPVDSGGQRGVFLIRRPGEAAFRLGEALASSRRGAALVEEFVDGLELNILAAVRKGETTVLTISDRLRPGGLGFGVGWIHSFPSSLDEETLDEVREVVRAAITVLGMRDGIAFPQVIVASDGVYVVEVAARIAAGQMTDLVRYGTGIELFRIAFAQSLGQTVPDELVTPRFVRPIAIRFLTASPGVLPVGTITGIHGLDAVKRSPGVLAAGLYVGVGAQIRPLQVDADRNGYVVATGESPREALARADAAAAHLRVSTTSERALCRSKRSSRRSALPVALSAALILVSVAVFLLSGPAKLDRPLVTRTRVDRLFAPRCHCGTRLAHLRFTLTRRARVSVEMLAKTGRVVATFAHDRLLGPGTVRFTWDGRRNSSTLPDGTYTPEVSFPALRRSLRLPSRITIDDRPPAILHLTRRVESRRIVIGYSLSERAHAMLLYDGRPAVVTQLAPREGSLDWSEEFVRAPHVVVGIHRLTFVAIDLAGNRTRRTIGTVRLSLAGRRLPR